MALQNGGPLDEGCRFDNMFAEALNINDIREIIDLVEDDELGLNENKKP